MVLKLSGCRVLMFDGDNFAGFFYLCKEGVDFRPGVVHPVNPDFDTWYQAFRMLGV